MMPPRAAHCKVNGLREGTRPFIFAKGRVPFTNMKGRVPFGAPSAVAAAVDGVVAEAPVDAVEGVVETPGLGEIGRREQVELRLGFQVADADAEQAYGGARLLREPMVEQVRSDLRDQARLLRRRVEAPLARVGLEVAAAHLDADHACLELARAQARRGAVGELGEPLLHLRVVADVDVEGLL